MKTLAHDELKSLTEWEQGPCISIYLPRHQALTDYREDPIHLRNMLDQAETALQERGMGTGEIKTLLEPLNLQLPIHIDTSRECIGSLMLSWLVAVPWSS